MLNVPGHVGWIGYISVDDVDAHVEKIVEAGGKLWKPATDVPGMLRFAVMSDPQGAAIVVSSLPIRLCHRRHALRHRPPAPSVGARRLYTTDLEGGFDFYNKLFGWTKVTDMDMGPMGTYRIFDEGDQKQMGDGGMMNKTPQLLRLMLDILFQRRLDQRSRQACRIRRWKDHERPGAGTRRGLDHPGSGSSGGHVLSRQQQGISTIKASLP